ncbi:MAG: PD-(D/E)XK nuclease domain-containing protein [Deltaproteobacteria bacterium]|jgi:hypothetical protein|nr:PD-(D/E)XK nuclease domain-containing protein [Deltaproteobacteria bacterium]
MLPALPRLPDLQGLIDRKEYFTLHAPRQSGKTTVMMAAVDSLNEGGAYYALYCTLEELCGITDRAEGMNSLIGILFGSFKSSNAEALKEVAKKDFWTSGTNSPDYIISPLLVRLRELSAALDKELIVFFDEADCLAEGPLLSFLSQLRRGYVERSKTPFPSSIALIGMRNIRDYKIKIRPDSESLGSSSPFNIITEAMTIADFTIDQIKELYSQHTEATGQVFAEEAIQRTWYWSEGQPWLVNALARQVINKILNFDSSPIITADYVDTAADNLMRIRDTHIDSLLARLHEPRVKKFIEPMLACSKESVFTDKSEEYPSLHDDLQYCLDLGLVKQDPGLRPSNPIYASVISRYLNSGLQNSLPPGLIGQWMDGHRLDLTALLKEFQKFWAERADRYLSGCRYLEAAPHSLLTAFLQRVVNGGAIVIEEYADALGYADIVVKYARKSYVIELKIKDNQDSLEASKRQLAAYMDPLLVKEGWLVIFDRMSNKSWSKKISWETVTMETGQIIHVVNC